MLSAKLRVLSRLLVAGVGLMLSNGLRLGCRIMGVSSFVMAPSNLVISCVKGMRTTLLVLLGVGNLLGVLGTGRGLGSIGKTAGAQSLRGLYDVSARLASSSARIDGSFMASSCDHLIVGGSAKGEAFCLGDLLVEVEGDDFLFGELPNTVGE